MSRGQPRRISDGMRRAGMGFSRRLTTSGRRRKVVGSSGRADSVDDPALLGEFLSLPYPQATSVAGPVGGMEYPMFVMVH